MYCIKCGVELADTEKKCPLCDTVVYHPEVKQGNSVPLYPKNNFPRPKPNSKVLCGALLILFLIPIFITIFADKQRDGVLNWSGYAIGALTLGYVFFALPLWFRKPNPVIFVACDFVASIVYLLYINLATGGKWFLSFAFPIMGGIALITTTVITLVYYLRRGRLYIFGGAFMALGALMPLIEFLLGITFGLISIGWCVYPFVVLFFLGGMLIYLAINESAREAMERKLFF